MSLLSSKVLLRLCLVTHTFYLPLQQFVYSVYSVLGINTLLHYTLNTCAVPTFMLLLEGKFVVMEVTVEI